MLIKNILKNSAKQLSFSNNEKTETYGIFNEYRDDFLNVKNNMIGHNGSDPGVFTAMYFNPKEKFGFVVISNGCNPIASTDMPDLLSKTMKSLYANFIN